ncbi:MAG: elongation factor Ts [Lutibacter sp.]|uniref:translation elongation factor Ts n=1 Tax=Lutibacter sp. TaxID=1925666 RepID=UPI0019F502CF|nr:translation elongation factor Ts [Lutibacter sp.]NOR28694.1 elongation factor Ts [Lutibacter sp.]
MAKITAAEVNNLRKSTGAGMMDCKNALVEAEGNFDKAVDILRKKGQKVADKRADRDTSEGAVIAKVNDENTKGAIISLNCETDFVAKNDDFVALATKFATIAVNCATKEDFLSADFGGMTVAEKLIEQTGVIGEKLAIGAFEKVAGEFVGSYIHVGNKIAAITALSSTIDGVAEVAKDLSMQAAAMGASILSYKDFDPAYIASETEARIAVIEKDNIELGRLGKTLKNVPTYISRAQLTDEVIAQETTRLQEQLKAEGKPEQIWDRIIPGKIERFISDNTTLDTEQCLLDQVFIKNEKQTVAEYVSSVGDVAVVDFKRVSIA